MNTGFAGLDWASQSHAVCVIDGHGVVCERFEIAHDAKGLADLCRRLRHWHNPAIAIERPSGLVVDTLVQAGFTVVPIHISILARAWLRVIWRAWTIANPTLPPCTQVLDC